MSATSPARSPLIRVAQQLLAGLPASAHRTLAIRVAAVGLEFACLLILARVFTAHTYGIYVLMMSTVAIGAVPATFGFDRLLVREVAARKAAERWSSLKGLLQSALQATFAASLVVALALLAIAEWVLPSQHNELATAMRLAAVLIPVVALSRLRQATLQGLGHVVAGQLPEAVIQPALVIALSAVTAIAVQGSRTPVLALGIQLVASATALALGAALLRRRLPEALIATVAGEPPLRWLAPGLAFMWLVAMSAIHANIDTILVGALLGPEEAGIYRVATQLAMFVGLPLTACSIALAPSISALHATGRLEELRLTLGIAARAILASAVLIAIFVSLAGPYVFAAFGPAFDAGYRPALILAAAFLAHSAMATSSYVLFMTAHERAATLTFAAGIAVNVTISLLLTPTRGILGAAIATAVSLCFVSTTCAYLAWRLTGINATVFARMRSRIST